MMFKLPFTMDCGERKRTSRPALIPALVRMSGTLLILTTQTLCAASSATDLVPAALNRVAAPVAWADRAWLLSVAAAGNDLIAVGERGIVLTSSDNGATWRQVLSVPTAVTLTKVRFASRSEGWATGHMGVVLHTADGGKHWTKVTDGMAYAKLASRQLKERADASTNHTQKAAFSQSADGLLRDGADKPFLALMPLAEQSLLAFGAFGIGLETDARGKQAKSLFENIDNPQGLHIYGVARHGNAIYAVGEQGLILKSVKEGKLSPLASSYKGTLFGILATRDGILLAYGLRGTVLRSVDGGATWSSVASGSSLTISSALELPDGRILLGSQSGQVCVSSDKGEHFAPLTLVPQPIADLVYTADGAIVAVGPRGINKLGFPEKAGNK